MSTILIVTGFLVVIFWGLLRLRDIRESAIEDINEPDKTAILLGLFYTISSACLRFYRDNGNYPQAVIGDPEGLIESGYLKDEPLAQLTAAVKLFSMVTSDKGGIGVCLAHTTSALTNEIINKAKETSSLSKFINYSGGQFIVLELPVTRLTVNLTLPLPLCPVGSTNPMDVDRIAEGVITRPETT
jgi:hypothetical protein